MINYLPPLYENEIIYSWMSRIASVDAYKSSPDINYLIFNKAIVMQNIYFPVYLSNFVNSIPNYIEVDEIYLIENHTLIPLLKPFIVNIEYEKIIKDVKRGVPFLLAYKLGANKVLSHNSQLIKLCERCLLDDSIEGIDLHIKRYHLSPGVYVCPIHHTFLKIYEIPASHQRYQFFELSEINKMIPIYNDDINIDKYTRLSIDINSILKGALEGVDIYTVRNKYRSKMMEKGYYKSTIVDREKLLNDFINFHSEEWLININLLPSISEKRSWFFEIFSDNMGSIFSNHVHHILFIQFLFGNLEEFNNYEYKLEFKPFGNGPWPCLNKASDHYGERLIKEITFTKNHEYKKEKSAKFRCECGFVYKRNTINGVSEDEFKYSAIIEFGHLWYKILEKKINEGKSINVIRKEMRTSHSSVVKYAGMLGLLDKLNTSKEYPIKRKSVRNHSELLNMRKTMLSNYISKNPEITRSKLKRIFPTEVKYIDGKESGWLTEQIKCNERKIKSLLYWERVDNELHKKIEKAAKKILEYQKPIRITKNSISRELNDIRIRQNKSLRHLPKTVEALSKVTEDFKDFKNRMTNDV